MAKSYPRQVWNVGRECKPQSSFSVLPINKNLYILLYRDRALAIQVRLIYLAGKYLISHLKVAKFAHIALG